MGMFTYSRNIPNPPDNPAFDVTLMQQNSQSINDLIAIEHQGFNTNTNVGGYHTHVTFADVESTPALAASQIQIYPQNPTIIGTATSNYLENFVSDTNSSGVQTNGYLPFVKALVRFQSLGGDGPIVPTTGYMIVNVQQIATVYQIVQSGGGSTITINFATQLPNAPYFVFQTADSQFVNPLTLTANAGSLVISRTGAIPTGQIFAFMVI